MSTRHIIFLFALLTAALVPYLYAACFIVPLADDYCMGWEAIRHPDLISAISRMYCHWNGRYTADLLVMLNPFIRWGTAGYELASVLMIASGIVVNYLLSRRFVQDETSRWLTALTIQLLLLFQLPDLSEGIYWYNGYMLYYLPALVFMVTLLLVTDVMSIWKRSAVPYVKAALAILLIFLTAGFNEPMAVISLLFFTALFIYTFRAYPRLRLFIGLCLFIAFGSMLLVWLAPGNHVRASQFHFDRSIVKVILMTHLQIIRFVADWISNLPFIFLSIVVMVRAGRLSTSWIDSIRLWWLVAAIYVIMLCCIALPYWFTGILGQQRTVNLAYCFFIPLVFLALVKISRSRFVFRLFSFLSSDRAIFTLVVISVIFMAITRNGYKLGYDIAYGSLPAYHAEQVQRQQLLLDHLHDDVYRLPALVHRPLSITLYDELNPKFYWAEDCQRQYLLEEEGLSKH